MMGHIERSAERDTALEAMLPNVAFDGWTKRALRNGGIAAEDADFLFPHGGVEMIETFCDLADRRMEDAAKNLSDVRVSHRVRAVIALRLEQNRIHKEAIRHALAVLALPRNARVAAASTARTVDAIWRAAGDRSVDISWYTKRAILTGVYAATLLYWLRDVSDGDASTLAFLDRRLAGVARITQVRSRVEAALSRLPLPRVLRTGDTG